MSAGSRQILSGYQRHGTRFVQANRAGLCALRDVRVATVALKGVPGYAHVPGCVIHSEDGTASAAGLSSQRLCIRPTHGSLVDEIGGWRDPASVRHTVECHRPCRLGVLAKPPDDCQVHVRNELTRLPGHRRARGGKTIFLRSFLTAARRVQRAFVIVPHLLSAGDSVPYRAGMMHS
jgi:hypothetical protein